MSFFNLFGPENETEKFRARWLQWAAGFFGGATFFSQSYWEARYYNGILQECAWTDVWAIFSGGLALVLISIFWKLNTSVPSQFMGKVLRCSVAATSLAMVLYGFGIGGDGPCPTRQRQSLNYQFLPPPVPQPWPPPYLFQ